MAKTLSPLPPTATVINATCMFRVADVYAGSRTDGIQAVLLAYPILTQWNTLTVTWNTRPTVSTEALDFETFYSTGSETYIYYDITRLAQDWYHGSDNYGFALKVSGTADGCVKLYSSDRSGVGYKPKLTIEYRDTKGLDDRWTFASQSVGEAGAGYVNGFNGNLVYVHHDKTTKGSILPVTVSHVFNAANANEEFSSLMPVGKGWKLSVQETITQETIDTATWYRYSDGDGTDLYFMEQSSSVYVSEDGLGLTLTFGSNDKQFCLTDDYGNKKYFNTSGNLSSIEDVNENVKTFTYSSDKLTSISYTPNGSSTPATQLTFDYYTNGAVKTITDGLDSTDYVTFKYSSDYNGNYSTSAPSGYLRSITYSKGGGTTISYNSDGMVSYVKDNSTERALVYAYASHTYTATDNTQVTVCRVSRVTENGFDSDIIDWPAGQSVRFTYGDKSFQVRTSGTNDAIDDSDDLLTTYLFDNEGKEICTYTGNVYSSAVYGASNTKYEPTEQGSRKNGKITSYSAKGANAFNLLTNGNLESSSGWTNAASGSGYSSSFSAADSFLGNKSLKLYSTFGGTGYTERSATVSIPSSGTYTFSAYVKTDSLTLSSGGGASILLDGTESEIIGTETNTSIQNGWRRISVTKTFASSGTKTLKLRLKNIRGIAYFDCLQLEKGEAPSGFCLTQNGHMELQNSWTGVSSYPIDANRGPSVCLSGNPDAANCASQTVQLNIPKETTLLLSGWGRAASARTGEDDNGKERSFRLTVRLHYTDNTTEDQHAEFNPDQTAWQFTSAAIIPKEDVDYAEIFLRYDYNVNSAYFDDVCMTVEPAQTYTHDANGNVESATDALGNLTDPGYTGVDLTSLTLPVGSSYVYNYDTNHQVTSVIKTENGNEQTTDYVYDAFGNPTSATLTVEGYTGLMCESATYSSDGNDLLSVTDMLNGTTSYTYDSITKLVSAIEDANSHRTGYVYDSRYRIQKIYNDKDSDGVADSNEESVLYNYTLNELSGIQTATTGYTLQYDPFGNLKSVKAGNQTLASYTYGLYNGKIQRITYGNGSYEEYTYDHLDRVKTVKYNGDSSKTQTFVYTSEGNVYSITDSVAGILYLCEYDSLGRLIRGRQMKTSDGSVILETENRYDGYGRAAGSETALGSKTISYGIAYETGSDRVSSVSLSSIAGSASIGYTYDVFDRLTEKTATLSGGSHSLTETYGYYSYVSGGTNRLTPLINSVTLKKDGTGTATYSYLYDQSGNITAVFENNYLVHSYEYDSLGQLTRENDAYAGKTWVYSYDKAGNFVYKDEYAYTAGTLSNCLGFDYYLYSSSSWGDLLTEYDGTAITYDAIGNPLNWRNATGLTWNGRKLTQATFNSMDSVAYTYTADGTRTRKVYNSGTMMESHIHDYVLDGGKILYEKYQISAMGGGLTHHLYYFYDGNGSIAGLEYDGTPYYFQKNLQGDIVRICDGNGNTVVQYRYDAWGNVLSVSGSLANTLGQINPFRYRGYYYDTETGFYYLQTRYYDPKVGRFLNADSIIGANDGIVININLYSYCDNEPVFRLDSDGTSWKSLWDGFKKAVRSILHGGNTVARSFGIDTAACGAYFLGMKKDRNGIYHATFDCWQRYFGYNEGYDFMFDIGTSMKTRHFTFSYSGKQYRFWMWKGDYINLGAGAELGIYYYGALGHWLVDQSKAQGMSIKLIYKGNTIVSYGAGTWWITGFNPEYQNVKANELTALFQVTFNNPTMYEAFRDSKPAGWKFINRTLTAKYSF